MNNNSESISSQFTYINCDDNGYEDTQHKISAVTFEYKHTLTFLFPLTIKGAIEKAEEYLSQPLTREYYERIKDDLFHKENYESASKWFTNRGECLTDAINLERITTNENLAGTHINLWCGS